MQGEAPTLHLYGGVAWSHRGRRSPAPPGFASQILAALAEAEHSPVAADDLLDRLWGSAPPASGRKALQSHISRIRRHVRQTVGADIDPVVHDGIGYQLDARIRTDLDLIAESPPPSPLDADGPRWAEEPLADLPWEPFDQLRGRLRTSARTAALAWSDDPGAAEPREVARILEAVGIASPLDPEIWEAAAAAARAAGDPLTTESIQARIGAAIDEAGPGELADRLQRIGADIEPIRADASGIAGLAAAWLVGDPETALERIDTDLAGLPVTAPLKRIVTHLGPTDGWMKEMFTEMIGTWDLAPRHSERVLIALDARVLEMRPESEWDEALLDGSDGSIEATIRRLRTEILARLSRPLSPRIDDAVAELAAIDHPDAVVESTRLAAVLAARRGEFADVVRLIDRYEAEVAARWPDHVDAFASLAMLALSLRPGLDDLAIRVDRVNRFPLVVTDRSTAELAQLLHHLETERFQRDSTVGSVVTSASLTLPDDGASGLGMLWRLNIADHEAARDWAHHWVTRLESHHPTRFYHLLLVGMAKTAIECNDRDLASATYSAIEPWAGEELGLWPVDALFGPADEWLDHLR